MFERYENSNFHLDFWESCENGTCFIHPEIPEGFEKTLAKINRITEAFEFEGKWYDSLDDVYHVGSAKEFDDPRQLMKAVNVANIRKNYPTDNKYPVDFHIQFIDPKNLKRVALMVVYESNPFGKGPYGGEKATCRIVLFKSKAFAISRTQTTNKFAFEIKNKEDVKRVYSDQGLRIIWHPDPRKDIKGLKPSEVQREIVSAMSKLNSAGYYVIGEEDDAFDRTMRKILNATR